MSSTTRNLSLLKSSASTARVLNLHWIKQKRSDDPEYAKYPFFETARLNEAIIIKHTLRRSEQESLKIERASATKVVLPFSTADLKLGGYSAFVEQEDFEPALIQLLGAEANKSKLSRDLEVLRELARLPSLDPYLMRERFNRLGYKVGKCYFDISEADVKKLEAVVALDIKRLITLAYGEGEPTANALSEKLARMLLTDETDEALTPLRETLHLTAEQHAAGMFSWKGFLYYKWLVGTQRSTFKPVAEQILTLRVLDAHPEDTAFLDKVRREIVDQFSVRIQDIESALASYDRAFNKLVADQKPNAFRKFLMMAPHMFIETGEHLAAVNHITSFWRYRFPPGSPKRIPVDDAYDLFREFASCLEVSTHFVDS